MPEFVRTGVFATAEELERIKAAASAPYIVVGGYAPPDPRKIVHAAALAHDLPEISGYYGIDIEGGGEFLRSP